MVLDEGDWQRMYDDPKPDLDVSSVYGIASELGERELVAFDVDVYVFAKSLGAHTFKKYFSPKWTDFTAHGKLEDMMEASLAVTIRMTRLQVDLKESEANLLQLAKKLDGTNDAQKVTAKALETTNKGKR
ncbi:hypothetical protein Adt_14375 [Abeliophyllum distichum]|uniref:Uncharacterized protein n=1 Tax=Abeliophyllum distichum TaxID=126358 RepID=A0ABD1TZG3_9LAMI